MTSDKFLVRRTFVLHESTVKRANDIKATRRRTVAIRRAMKHHSDKNLIVIKVHPAVWKTAMRLARGNANRIQILSTTECIVR